MDDSFKSCRPFFVHFTAPLTVYILINVDEIIKLPAVLKNYRKHNWVKNLTRQEPAAEPEALAQAAA